jgi:hypothetical protein
MHALRSWLRKHTVRRRCVAGLDVSADGVRLVILAGDAQSPDTVCCAEKLTMPYAWVADGVVQSPQALVNWLHDFLKNNDYSVEQWFIGLTDDQVRYHSVSLPAGLSAEDVAFQLQQETREVFVDFASRFALDYEVDLDTTHLAAGELRYLVGACPLACAESWVAFARLGGFKLAALEPRRDALARMSHTHLTGAMPAASLGSALQCDAALGLALAGWAKVGYNFLPHRPLWLKALRRAWWLGMAVCAMGGAVLAAGFALVLSASADATGQPLRQGQSAEQQLAQARQAYQQVQAAQKLQTQLAQWIGQRQAQQAQSLAWSQTLSQASQGIWVSHIQQQGERWQVEGEALSSTHAQRLLGQLKALDIWAKSPELPQLYIGSSSAGGSATDSASVWIFRIEAELKAGG